MDPALCEMLHGEAEDEVAAFVRLKDTQQVPPNIRVITRFGDVVTCRLRRGDIENVWSDDTVLSVKAPRPLGAENIVHTPDPFRSPAVVQEYTNENAEVPRETGLGVVVGIVDWGLDFVHPDFRAEDGQTRLIALWDQRAKSGVATNHYGRGVIHSADQINAGLSSKDPHVSLDYTPGRIDHGTHVSGIAVGNGRGGGPNGVAPKADIVFVHLSSGHLSERANFGDTVAVPEAVHFILEQAKGRPCVINLSMGRHGGPHDGSTHVERALDNALTENNGLAIINSAGNYFDRRTHSAGRLRPGQRKKLHWHVDAADTTPNELEVWYSGADHFGVQLISPDGKIFGPVGLSNQLSLEQSNNRFGSMYHRAKDPNNGSNHIDIFLYPDATPGPWVVELVGRDVVDGRYDAWIERDFGNQKNQSRFSREDAEPFGTTGTIANGLRTIAVGAYDAEDGRRPVARFSSAGTTRDGRQKPDLVAPGVRIVSTTIVKNSSGRQRLYAEKSGTSMAAPRVAGTVALMFEAAPTLLPIVETRRLLLSAADTPSEHEDLQLRIGSGFLNIEQAVEQCRKLATTDATVAIKGEDSMSGEQKQNHIPAHLEAGLDSNANFSMDGNSPPSSLAIHEETDIDFENEAIENLVITDNMVPGIHEMEPWDASPEEFETTNPNEVAPDLAVIALVDDSLDRGDWANDPVIEATWWPESHESESDGFETYPSAAMLFDMWTAPGRETGLGEVAEQFDVLAYPGDLLSAELVLGDLMIRRALGEGGLAVASLITGPSPKPWHRLRAGVDQFENRGAGLYVQVAEGGFRPHQSSDFYHRRIADDAGRVAMDTIVLRPRIISDGLEDWHQSQSEDANFSEVAEGNQATLEWRNLHMVRGSGGIEHLYYLLGGRPGHGDSQFTLRVTNNNTIRNFVDPYLLVRLRQQRADGSRVVVPLDGADANTGWKRIESREVVDEEHRDITLNISRQSRLNAYNEASPLTWIDAKYRWRQGRTHYGKNTSLGFYLVDNANLMLSQGRVIQWDLALNDPTIHRRYWIPLIEKTFTSTDQTPLHVEYEVQATINNSSTRGVTVTGTRSRTVGTSQTLSQETTFSRTMEAGIDEVIRIGASSSQSTTIGSSFTWNQSNTSSYARAAARSSTFGRAWSQRITVSGDLNSPSGGGRQRMFLYPVVNVHLISVVEYGRPNNMGQATRRTVVRGVPIAVPSSWGVIVVSG